MNLRSVILRPQSPEGVTQDDDGSFHLAAADARIVGHTAQLEDENIGYWNNPNDYVEWKLRVRTPGTFKVAIDFACNPANAGTEYQIIVGNHKLSGKVAPTKGWRDFQTAQLGTISIPAPGTVTLQVKPIPRTMSPVMNLRTAFLQPQ
jgi:alpha-L-fucosidase